MTDVSTSWLLRHCLCDPEGHMFLHLVPCPCGGMHEMPAHKPAQIHLHVQSNVSDMDTRMRKLGEILFAENDKFLHLFPD